MGRIVSIDFHTHLNEKHVKPKAFWSQAKKLKLDGVAITEHIEYKPKKAFERLEKEKPADMLLVPGMELFTNIGHVLALSSTPEIFEIEAFMQKGLDISSAVNIARQNNAMLCVAHPWGFELDSAAYLYGEKKLARLISENRLGVEVYNGIVGCFADYLRESKAIRRSVAFFSYLERNRVARRIGLQRLGRKVRSTYDKKANEMLSRSLKAIDLGEHADFILAGSDAHSAHRVGIAITRMKFPESLELNAESILQQLSDRANIVWAGPYIEEKEKGIFERKSTKLKKMELLQGLKYVTKAISKKRLKKAVGEKV